MPTSISFGRWSCACQDVDGVLFSLLHSSSAWASIADPKIDKAGEAPPEVKPSVEEDNKP